MKDGQVGFVPGPTGVRRPSLALKSLTDQIKCTSILQYITEQFVPGYLYNNLPIY